MTSSVTHTLITLICFLWWPNKSRKLQGGIKQHAYIFSQFGGAEILKSVLGNESRVSQDDAFLGALGLS